MSYKKEHIAKFTDSKTHSKFRRKCNEYGEGVDSIYGSKNLLDEKQDLHSIRFDAKKFSPSEARTWLVTNDKNHYTDFKQAEVLDEDAGMALTTTDTIGDIKHDVAAFPLQKRPMFMSHMESFLKNS